VTPFADPSRLFDVPPIQKLTDRQQRALAAITVAGFDGLHTDELGAILHAGTYTHALHDRCTFCGAAGNEVGKALRKKGLVQQRRRRAVGGDTYMVWTVAGKLSRAPERDYDLPSGF
jgi:hypothetical protein